MHERILAAATRVFLDRGRDGARMQAIADEAGINKALLHYYFRSKDRLYREIVQREVSRSLQEFLTSFSAQGDIDDVLWLFIDNYIDLLARNPQVVRFLAWELGGGGLNVRDLLKRTLGASPGPEMQAAFVGLIERSMREGTIRPIDPRHFIMNVLGMCLYAFLAAPILGYAFPDFDTGSEQFIRKRKTEIYELAWRGIKTHGRRSE